MTLTEAFFYILIWVIGTCVAAMVGIIVSDKIVEPFLKKVDEKKRREQVTAEIAKIEQAQPDCTHKQPELHLIRNQHSNVGVTKFPKHRHQFGSAHLPSPPDAAA